LLTLVVKDDVYGIQEEILKNNAAIDFALANGQTALM